MIKKCLARVRSCSHHVHYGQIVLFHSVFYGEKPIPPKGGGIQLELF